MSRKRLIAATLGLAIVLSATAGWALYRLAVTGQTMAQAAERFLATLSEQERAKAVVAYDDKVRVDWHFIPKPDGAREGLQVGDMNDQQRRAAYELLQAALSEVGYNKARQIMELESLLRELERPRGGKQIRDPHRYFFTIYGSPGSQDQRWGLSVEGHHLSLNFVVEKGNVISSTPTAFCANPAIVMNEAVPSIKKGTRVLAKEETLAFELLASLTPEQKKQAVIADKAPGEIRAAGDPQPPREAPAGISADKLTGKQRAVLMSLIDEYANNLPPDVAKERHEAVDKEGPANIYFAWAGGEKEGVGHYYRIQGSTFLIEFVNVQADSAGNPANHIHSVWRDLRGDFAIPIQ